MAHLIINSTEGSFLKKLQIGEWFIAEQPMPVRFFAGVLFAPERLISREESGIKNFCDITPKNVWKVQNSLWRKKTLASLIAHPFIDGFVLPRYHLEALFLLSQRNISSTIKMATESFKTNRILNSYEDDLRIKNAVNKTIKNYHTEDKLVFEQFLENVKPVIGFRYWDYNDNACVVYDIIAKAIIVEFELHKQIIKLLCELISGYNELLPLREQNDTDGVSRFKYAFASLLGSRVIPTYAGYEHYSAKGIASMFLAIFQLNKDSYQETRARITGFVRECTEESHFWIPFSEIRALNHWLP